jgi:hypothetical protein
MSRNARSALVFWATPATAALFGSGYFAADAVAGHPGEGVVALAAMLAVGAAFVLGARYSETIRGLLNRRDERITGIDLHATAVAGLLVILAVLIGSMVEMARGHSGAPYTWLAVVAGVGYIVAVIVERARR